MFTSEFDIFRRDNLRYAERLKAVGKLIDVSDMPGVTHAYQTIDYDIQETTWFYEEEKMVFDAYCK